LSTHPLGNGPTNELKSPSALSPDLHSPFSINTDQKTRQT